MATAICRRFCSRQQSMSWVVSRAQKHAYSTQKLSNSEIRTKRNQLFEAEHQRQMALVTRVEKIQVEFTGKPEQCTLIMNKSLSTPFNCAMHMSEHVVERAALALVNGKPWDMHRPLAEDCTLEFMHFDDDDPRVANDAFWKSCSFVLGHVLETAFKDQHHVELCSFPPPNVNSGSFVYDANLNIGDWEVTPRELNCLSRIGLRLRYEDIRFNRLDVPVSVAETMFEDNKFKKVHVQAMAAKSESGDTVPVYKLGEHIDLSSGPLISSTHQIGRFSVCAIHDINSPDFGKLQRIQGLALPTQITMHSWTYDTILRPRAAKLNLALIPEIQKQAQVEAV